MDYNNYSDLEDQIETQEEQQPSVDQQHIEQESVLQELEQCQQDAAQWKDKAARIFADFENYKKRMEKEQASWIQTAQLSMLKDLLTVIDNFDRALSTKNDAQTDVYAGIEMIYKSVVQLLQKYGVKEFTEYTTFDPELHEALMDVQSPDHQSGQIVQVLEKGFMIKDKVLRPAKVMIAK